MTVQSYLARRVPSPAATPEEMEALRRRAWLKNGVAALSPDDDRLPWDVRETIRQAAEKLYGKREGRP